MPYTALEPANEVRYLEFTGNTPDRKPHNKLLRFHLLEWPILSAYDSNIIN